MTAICWTVRTPVEANANGKLLGKPSGYTAQQITLGFTPGLQPAQYPSTLTDAENYNCGGTWELDYNSPGAQEFVDSEADEFASWGVDFVKLDGILDQNTTDLQAWSKALNQTGRPIELDATEGVYDIAIAPTLDKYATQWEYSPDIESGNANLTSHQSADVRFNTAALWQAYGGAGKGSERVVVDRDVADHMAQRCLRADRAGHLQDHRADR
jgi:Alpha galactosidase A